jgi:signal transduction histidine kinase
VKRIDVVVARGLALAGLALAGPPLFALVVLGLALLPFGLGLGLLPQVVFRVRALANLNRRLARQWSDVPIPTPYRPMPELPAGLRGRVRQVGWIVADPATWRDQAWLLVNGPVGVFLGGLPTVFVLNGVWGFVIPFVWRPISDAAGTDLDFYGIPITSQLSAALLAPALGVVSLVLGLWGGPRLLRVHALVTRWLLAPTRKAELDTRVRRLTETRADAVDSQAAELRRIERDLHDGAQARLVAMGMTLGAAERLLDDDPAAARTLLVEAREASSAALRELRDLVRGIHPPVLADRGLADAVRSLALASPLAVEVAASLAGRPPPPVESAAYFAICELIANATKHARASQMWVDIRHAGGVLRVTVTDDGHGGADAAQGTGLRGLRRRLGTFDGILALSSPPGGPTVVTMELPCALSSPRTSSY